ncbi:MAG: DNA-processing protein DprA [Oscillospiraceae bacterium]|nr:DNA-processing protein DprA [Oscillospiraceae bacterium]
MTENSKAIAVFCSTLATEKELKPLEPRKWGEIALKLQELKREPEELLNYSVNELQTVLDIPAEQACQMGRLRDRSAALFFEISKYENMGINIVTRADKLYPVKLKRKLKNQCPPLFYIAGESEILNSAFIGFVGSRSIEFGDEEFTRNTVNTVAQAGYGVVSGGAKGVDSVSEDEGMNNGINIVEFVSDSMMRKLRSPKILTAVQNGNMVILSEVKPDAGFNAGMAMARNKYIYIQSEATVVVRTDLNKGGTWGGATECLKKGWVPVLCRNKESYPGNMALIERGAIPIDQYWDGSIPDILGRNTMASDSFVRTAVQEEVQLSFDGF